MAQRSADPVLAERLTWVLAHGVDRSAAAADVASTTSERHLDENAVSIRDVVVVR